ncbi:MAG: DUF3025 domain-containing protein [Gammaproteobacteria bacterium]|nr:DUF3025 domain-containing protein [Gammaproteobacteria bacterium]
MNIDQLVPWQANFADRSPLFAPLEPLLRHFASHQQWPELADYQQLLAAWPDTIRTLGGNTIRVVPQDDHPEQFEMHYAPRIYLSGEIQTRRHNWHDFFQFLSWFLFPQTKAIINSLHLEPARQRYNQGIKGARSPLENMLSLFDEGGAVVVSSNEQLLQMVREFRWKDLFWHHRTQLTQQLQCFTFGHAVYEKALMPYVGMTANAILLTVDDDFFTLPLNEQLQQVDRQLAAVLQQGQQFCKPKDLHPFPILGMPGWSDDNQQEHYYDNQRYFRPGRRATTG